VAGVADEEHASLGADALVAEWRADAAVVAEPTGLEIAVGHKGFAWLELRTEGRAAHGSRPDEGRDAIAMMGRVLVALEHLDRGLRARPRDPVLGTASLHASLVSGGRELSSYPDACTLQYERRTLAHESGATALAEAERILESLRAEDGDFRGAARVCFERPAYLTPAGHALPDLLEAALGRPAPRGGMSFWTDAAILGRAGIPSVVFGPGGAGLHGLEEFVNVEDVLTCRETLRRLAPRFCGG
jgi:acetylornithine deacetylase